MTPYFDRFGCTLYQGDALAVLASLPAASVQCCVTSPPYFGLRAYGTDPLVWDASDPACEHEWGEPGRSSQRLRNGQGSDTAKVGFKPVLHPPTGATCARCGAWRGELGSEPTPDLYVRHLVAVFAAVRRVLRADSVCWINVGDSYGHGTTAARQMSRTSQITSVQRHEAQGGRHGGQAKNLLLIPFRLALALQADGWTVRQTVIWSKRAPMPESVRDRPTTAHEYVFMLAKSERYFYDTLAVAESATHAGRTVRASGDAAKNAAGITAVKDRRTALGFTTHDTLAGATRNLRSVWELSPSPFTAASLGITDVDHFAAYPEELARRAIRASTSERGACPACGAPWERVVDWERRPRGAAFGHKDVGRYDHGEAGAPYVATTAVQTTDWRPTCPCPPAEPVPCVILDPFAGSGTTLRVAQRLGRRAVGIELSADYCRIVEARVGRQGPLDFAPDAEVSA